MHSIVAEYTKLGENNKGQTNSLLSILVFNLPTL